MVVLFSRTPDISYSFDTGTGTPFNYFSYGAACSEVEIDCLTGDHQVVLFIDYSNLLMYLWAYI